MLRRRRRSRRHACAGSFAEPGLPHRSERAPCRENPGLEPGTALAQRLQSPRCRSSMKAVVSASVMAARPRAWRPSSSRRPAHPRPGHGHPGREPAAHGFAGARVHDVVPLAHAGGPERRLPHRQAGEHARGSTGIAQGQRPALAARWRLEREDGAEAAVDEREPRAPTPRAAPPSDRPRSPCRCRRDRSARPPFVARTRKSSGSSSSDGNPVPIEMSNAPPVRSNTCRAITRHSSVDGLTGVLSPAARWLTRVMSLLDRNRLSSRSRRSDEIEGSLRRLCGVPLIGVHGVHLEDGGHRLVREAPHVAELARRLDREPAVRVGSAEASARPFSSAAPGT